MADTASSTTLEWFGATTFRLRTQGLTIFLDAWLERPSCMPTYLRIDEVTEADYIFISHAHFDHLPGADRLAKRTGAIVIANGEAINVLRGAGVKEEQLVPVAGGERIPLFSHAVRKRAARGEEPLQPGPPGAPPTPDHSLAAMSVHVWPALHCLMPGSHVDLPDVMDTGRVYTGAANPFVCTLDITRGMKYGLLKIGDHIPPSDRDEKTSSFIDYIEDPSNVYSHYDGGQLMYNFLFQDKAVLFSAHLGAYEWIMSAMSPKPDAAILGIAGRANLNGRPFDGSAAEFALKEIDWLAQPKQVIWCLHDESAIKPFSCDVGPATKLVESKSSSRVLEMPYAKPVVLDL